MSDLPSLFTALFGDALPVESESAARLRLKHRKLDALFVGDPDVWYLEHYDELLTAIHDAPGMKLRVSAPSIDVMRSMTPLLAVLADTVVLSPAPPWSCSFLTVSTRPWPGFLDSPHGGISGLGAMWNHGDWLKYACWLAALRPLLAVGRVIYLPRIGFGWEHERFGFPMLGDLRMANGEPASEVHRIMEALRREHAVSRELDCVHIEPSIAKVPVGAVGLVEARDRHVHANVYAQLRLRVPRIENATNAELASILLDETESVVAFRRAVRVAMQRIVDADPLRTPNDQEVRTIQRDVIDEPLAILEARLKRLDRIRRNKYAAYGLAAGAVALLSARGAPAWITGSIGVVSVANAMEAYLTDADKAAELHADALYWLTRLRDDNMNAP